MRNEEFWLLCHLTLQIPGLYTRLLIKKIHMVIENSKRETIFPLVIQDDWQNNFPIV